MWKQPTSQKYEVLIWLVYKGHNLRSADLIGL